MFTPSERKQGRCCLVCPLLGTYLPSDSIHHSSRVHKNLQNCPKYWLGVTNNSQAWNPQIRRIEGVFNQDGVPVGQFLLHYCCMTFSKWFIFSVAFLFSITWISIQTSRHNKHHFLHEDCPTTSVESELFLFLWSQVTTFPWHLPRIYYRASDNSYVVGAWGSFIYTHYTAPSSTSPPLVPLTATSWPSWPMTAAWLCANPCFMSPSRRRKPTWVLCLALVFLACLCDELFLYPQYSSSVPLLPL